MKMTDRKLVTKPSSCVCGMKITRELTNLTTTVSFLTVQIFLESKVHSKIKKPPLVALGW
jgi:hypothetical protein